MSMGLVLQYNAQGLRPLQPRYDPYYTKEGHMMHAGATQKYTYPADFRASDGQYQPAFECYIIVTGSYQPPPLQTTPTFVT